MEGNQRNSNPLAHYSEVMDWLRESGEGDKLSRMKNIKGSTRYVQAAVPDDQSKNSSGMNICKKQASELLKSYHEVMDYCRNNTGVNPNPSPEVPISKYQELENFEPFYNIISHRTQTKEQEQDHEHLILEVKPQKNKQLVFAGEDEGEREEKLDQQMRFCYQMFKDKYPSLQDYAQVYYNSYQ